MKSEKEKNEDVIRAATKAMLTARPAAPPDHGNRQCRTACGAWTRPHHSESLAVNPEDIESAKKEYAAKGVSVDFDKHGRAIITSARHYHKVAKAMGLFHGAHGYGPPGPDGEKRALTGRGAEEAKAEFRRRVASGEYDF